MTEAYFLEQLEFLQYIEVTDLRASMRAVGLDVT